MPCYRPPRLPSRPEPERRTNATKATTNITKKKVFNEYPFVYLIKEVVFFGYSMICYVPPDCCSHNIKNHGIADATTTRDTQTECRGNDNNSPNRKTRYASHRQEKTSDTLVRRRGTRKRHTNSPTTRQGTNTSTTHKFSAETETHSDIATQQHKRHLRLPFSFKLETYTKILKISHLALVQYNIM
ncbi:hypothetical protein BDA99DRAFT_219422 [Phascolomyces articulosus]|uniref:Uncharacterized protein n=1 Tax=Phascolomyces articulosus TaxID=60185 RepID=A0AAD5P951_9FUNG|nr:hypothetical protein BDA99DRAFT_219422 [Phascolomyces articulosus]